MAPVHLKSIVSVSSEDPLNPAKNILYGGKVGKKWLRSTTDKSGCLEVVLELCKRARITSIEVGNFGTAFLEVLVGNSDTPDEFITLLPSSMLMTIPDSKAGRSRTKSKLFTSKDKLSSAAVGKKWNRVKVRCVQKHGTEQFGLQYITFSNDVGHPHTSAIAGTPSHSHLLTPPPLTSPRHTPATPKSEQFQRSRIPVLQKTFTPAGVKSHVPLKTPKRPLNERSNREKGAMEEEDFEFSGVEKQSRLFRNCMKGKPSTNGDCSSDKESNPILERIMNEREKYKSPTDGGLYTRKKLLKKELPKADVSVDFMAGYRENGGGKKKASELSGAWSRMASHDNDYEIGEEPEHTWGWNRYKGKAKTGRKRHSKKLDGWLSKRKKINTLIDECDAILTSASDRLSKSTNEAPSTAAGDTAAASLPGCSTGTEQKSEDSDNVYDYNEDGDGGGCQSGGKASSLVECPLCGCFFPHYVIEVHAGSCGESPYLPTRAASVYGGAPGPIVID